MPEGAGYCPTQTAPPDYPPPTEMIMPTEVRYWFNKHTETIHKGLISHPTQKRLTRSKPCLNTLGTRPNRPSGCPSEWVGCYNQTMFCTEGTRDNYGPPLIGA